MTMTLTKFLVARIADDEEAADDLHEQDCSSVQDGSQWGPCDCSYPARVLAECEAKRRIVGDYQIPTVRFASGALVWADCLRHLASVYADHPDYRDEWSA